MKVNSITTEDLDKSGRVTGTSNRKFQPKPSITVGADVWQDPDVRNVIKQHLEQSKESECLITIRTSQGKFRRTLARTK